MEILFSNHCSMDEETYGKIFSKLGRSFPTVLICLLSAGYGVYMAFRFHFTWYVVLMGIGLVLECIFMFFFTSKFRGKKMFRQACQLSDSGRLETDILFMDEAFENINPFTGEKLTTDYAQIVSLREYDEMYLMLIKGRQFLCLDKYGFVIGNHKDFEDFIREKCSKAKIRFKKTEE